MLTVLVWMAGCAQVGILGVKGSYTSPLVIPLLFITAIVAYVCRGVFERPFQVVSLRGAVDLDKHEKVGGLRGARTLLFLPLP